MADGNMTRDEYHTQLRSYWDQVRQSEGFDVGNVVLPPWMNGMFSGLVPYDCGVNDDYPNSDLVKDYGRVGLHRYNLLKGTNFQLSSLIKFNMLSNPVSSYYMTLAAESLDRTGGRSSAEFRVRVDEREFGTLDLACSVARIVGEGCTVTTNKPFVPHFHQGAVGDGIFEGELPDWPSDFSDENRFYVLKESEIWSSEWIRMYMTLVVCGNDRSITNKLGRSKKVLLPLKIVEAVIETKTGDVKKTPSERLNALNAHVYITFTGLEEPRAHGQIFEIGKHLKRKAVIRRVVDKDTQYLSLVGKLFGCTRD
ncbi:unnamed protein product [Thlaspi arvense]|uniref:Uncharacterized protein n=1 Tax=Thlaspi arvense TaxID=13288 RepID=A0AAU9R9I0_THLAR|nr:unnamed protein product [Thlaspi arvense]